jgi:uncharacterized membrane protein
MATEARLERVEHELEAVSSRLRRLERESGGERRGQPERTASLPPLPPSPQPRVEPLVVRTAARGEGRSALDLEQLFGGRVLAWVGGLAILFAAVLFVGMAISRGWIDEEARTIVAALGSLGLFFGGVWLHERQGRTEAARAAVGAAISGLYATILVATQAYDLVPPAAGLVLAALVAAAGFAVAVRWDAPVVAAVGGLGALAAPLLVGLGVEGASLAFVAVALAANVLVLLWRRWDWLALGAFAVSAPQLLYWLLAQRFDGAVVELSVAVNLMVLVGFWLLYALAAIGYELRTRDRVEAAVPIASWILLLVGGAGAAAVGYGLLQDSSHTAAVVWLFGFAAVHALLGEIAIRSRLHRELGALLVGLGIAVSACGCAAALDGPALVAAWAAEAVALAALSRRVDATPDPSLSARERLLCAAAGFLTLAVLHTLAIEAPPTALFQGVESLGEALGAIAACAGAALTLAWFLRRDGSPAAIVAGLAGAAALVYLGSVAIVDTLAVGPGGEVVQSGQTWLSAFWTVTGLGAVVWGLVRREGSVRLGGLALLGVAIAKVWTYDLAELEELARVLSFVGLGLLLLAGAFAYQRIKPGSAQPDPSAAP